MAVTPEEAILGAELVLPFNTARASGQRPWRFMSVNPQNAFIDTKEYRPLAGSNPSAQMNIESRISALNYKVTTV